MKFDTDYAKRIPKSISLQFLVMFGLFGFSMNSWAEDQSSKSSSTTAEAIFAGGCFWCMEPPYDKKDGVIETQSGYSGGAVVNPTYEQVSAGNTGHYEVIRVRYNPGKISYQELLELFWVNVDPVDGDGQFCDRGDQYRSGIFYSNDEEKKIAENSREQIGKKLNQKIATEILPTKEFYPAEDYHQDYYQKNPIRYKFYRGSCGRDNRLNNLWGK
ncbi:MAG: peptide-methionine (S)-S-oxide reductase MsrA [Pseudomonadota bacterium]